MRKSWVVLPRGLAASVLLAAVPLGAVPPKPIPSFIAGCLLLYALKFGRIRFQKFN